MMRSNLDVFARLSVPLMNGRLRRARPLRQAARVSVVVPCYNYGRFLRQCVDSVTRDQPGVEIEVIIVDDKSTDDSLAIAQQIARDDSRVRLIAHDRNQGHIATYNEGLEAATGEYVLLLSADDMVTPGALTRAAELLAAEPSVGLVYGNVIHFHDALPASRNRGTSWIIWPGEDWLLRCCRVGYNVVASPEVVMRTSVLRAIGGYRSDLPHAGDFEMWLRTSAVSDIGFLMGVDQAYYRHHNRNMNRVAFGSGTAKGQLTDLKQRWQSFEVVFAGVGSRLADSMLLLQIARRTMARHALEHAAYARGFRDIPTSDFETLATEIDPDVGHTRVGQALAVRKRLGMGSLPIHPLWALPAVLWRLEHVFRGWRRRRIGI